MSLSRYIKQKRKELFDFQKEAFSNAIDVLNAEKSALGVAPPGSGKTLISSYISEYFRKKTKLPSVFIVNRKEISDKTADELREVNNRLDIRQIGSGRKDVIGGDVDIVMVQSRNITREKVTERKYGISVFDEVHHYLSEDWRWIFDINSKYRYGTTATPYRSDGLSPSAFFKKTAFDISIETLIDKERLARPIGLSINTGLKMDKYEIENEYGDYKSSSIATFINKKERNEMIADFYSINFKGIQGITFCADLKHVKNMNHAYVKKGINSRMLTYLTPLRLRERILNDYNHGRIDMLVNKEILTEGVDLPSATACIMARATRSMRLYFQMSGRVMRTRKDLKTGQLTKKQCFIVDVNDTWNSMNDVIRLPDVFGLNNVRMNENRMDVLKLKKLINEYSDREPDRSVLYNRVSSEDELKRISEIEMEEINSSFEQPEFLKELAWPWIYNIPTKRYFIRGISSKDNTKKITIHVEITDVLHNYKITWMENDNSMRLTKAEVSAKKNEMIIEDVLRAIENRNHLLFNEYFGKEKWRSQPATDGQIKLLNSKKIKTSKWLSKGRASDIISALIPLTFEGEMPFGIHAGKKIEDVPKGYLIRLVNRIGRDKAVQRFGNVIESIVPKSENKSIVIMT